MTAINISLSSLNLVLVKPPLPLSPQLTVSIEETMRWLHLSCAISQKGSLCEARSLAQYSIFRFGPDRDVEQRQKIC
jgi:hypothetical protein